MDTTCEATDFGWALGHLRSGKKLMRNGWNGKGMHICLYESDKDNELPYIEMKTVDDKYVPWPTSQTDILAKDWCIRLD